MVKRRRAHKYYYHIYQQCLSSVVQQLHARSWDNNGLTSEDTHKSLKAIFILVLMAAAALTASHSHHQIR